MRRMSDTFHLSDTAMQPLSRFPATISTASSVMAAPSAINPVIAVAVGAGLATAAAGNLAIDIGKKINRTTAEKALHC
jgi:hypothetical protein